MQFKFNNGTIRLNRKANDDISRYWCYRLILDFGLWRQWKKLYLDDATLDFLKVSHLYGDDELQVPVKKVHQAIKLQFNQLPDLKAESDTSLSQNVKKLSSIIQLTAIEQNILLLVSMIHTSQAFGEIAENIEDIYLKDVYEIISGLLNIPLTHVKSALQPDATLRQSGIMTLDLSGHNDLKNSMELMDGLIDELLLPKFNAQALFERYFITAPKSALRLTDFNYIARDIQNIMNFLQATKESTLEGVNILLYGPPGTGKTELARLIGQTIDLTVHEIAVNDESNEPISGHKRFSTYSLAQYVLQNNLDSLILFDEIEDVFPHQFFDSRGNYQSQKAWVNRILETNAVPSIWITNDIDSIDDAFKRRFKFVLKMDIPPRQIRLKIIKQTMKDIPVSSIWLENLSEHPELSPAIVAQSAQVMNVITQDNQTNSMSSSANAIEKNLTQMINQALTCMNKKTLSVPQSAQTITYNPDVLNADCSIPSLIEGLNGHPSGRLCLYGPPGTGKTAFGHHIARRLDKKLLVKRASDILSCYWGETEKNIARMFEEAVNDEAALLLDEADSFLRDRKNAQYSWEVTAVNELLTQMEAFDGLFICSTNLIAELDEASIRRFDLKIKLDHLRTEQVWMLFSQVLKERDQLIDKKHWRDKLASLSNITPGDFSTIIRQNRLFIDKLTAERLFDGLESESRFKTQQQRSIGFTAQL